MRLLARALSHLSINSNATHLNLTNSVAYNFHFFSTNGGDIDWGSESTWSSGLTKQHFDGEVEPQKVAAAAAGGSTSRLSSATHNHDDLQNINKLAAEASTKDSEFANKWKDRMRETNVLMKQVIEPGARGAYLKDSEKAEIYRLHKQNPQVYTVDKLAKDYRIMRQRVHAILWLKEDEEKMEKKLGHPLDDSVEQLLDNFPE